MARKVTSVAYCLVASVPTSSTTKALSGNRLRAASGSEVSRMAGQACLKTSCACVTATTTTLCVRGSTANCHGWPT